MNGSSNTAKQQGTGFVNLQKMIGANKGNQLGSTIQQGVGNRVGQIQSDLNKQKQTFQTELGKNQLQESDKTAAQSTLNTAINAPKTMSNEQVSNFQNLLSGQYKGPSGLSNTAGIEAQARELGQYGSNVGSSGGRTNLLQRYVGGPKYTQGQQRVDNLLLGQTGGAALKDIRKQAMGLESQVTGAKSQAEMEAKKAQADRKAYGQELEKQIGRYDDPSTPEDESIGAIGDIYKDVQNRTKDFNNKNLELYNRIKTLGNTSSFTLDDLQTLGLTAGQNLYNVDLSRLAPAVAPQEAALQRVANEQDYAKYEALNRLAGRNGSFLTDRTMAGTAQEFNPDKEFLAKELASAESSYKNLIENDLKNLTNVTADTWRYADDTSDRRISSQVNNIDDARALLAAYDKQNYKGGVYEQLKKFISDYDYLNPDRVVSLYGERTAGDPGAGGGFGSGKGVKS